MRVLLTRSLWNEWRFLLKITVGSFLISTVIAIVLPKRYESEARLMTPGGMNSNTSVVGLLQSRTLALVVGLLRSRTLEDNLIDRFDLKRVYWDRTSEDARQDLEKHSEITLDDKYGIIAIRVRDGNPGRAVAMVQGYVDELNLLIIKLETTSAHRERVSLGNLVAQSQQDLESAQKGFSAFASDNLIVTMDAQENSMIDVPGAEHRELIVEQAERESEKSIYADESAHDPSTQPKMAGQVNVMIKAVGDVQNNLIAERAALKSLKSIYADANVEVRTTQAKVGQIQSELAKLVGKSNLTTTPRQDPQSLYPSLRNLPLLLTGYADLYRTVGKDALLFGTLAPEFELAKIAEMRDTPRITVLDPPNVPENKSWPPRLLIISLSILCSFSMAVAWIFATVCWQRWPEEEGKLFAIEVFRTIGAYFRLDVKRNWSSRSGNNAD